MATLLTLVNDLRILLREEEIETISDTDAYTQALIRIVNRAVTDVLEYRTWSFDKRTDGTAIYRTKVTGTNLTTTGEVALVKIETFTEVLYYAGTTSTKPISYFRVTSDETHPEIMYRITQIDTTTTPGSVWLTLSPNWMGDGLVDTTEATWEIFQCDYVLPSTVRKVLSVRDEEQPLQLYFSEKEIFDDRSVPRVADSAGDPCSATICGTNSSTVTTLSPTATTGTVLRILPIPDSERVIYYDYVYRHPEMTDATDELTAVPDRVSQLIVDRAFYHCLNSNIESDPERAGQVLKSYRVDIALAARDDRVAPNRRRVPRPFGSAVGRNSNYRWENQEVPAPS